MSARILVVDDEPRYRALYAQVLAGAGLSVVEAANAAEALEVIAAGVPDMVVSDVRMPGESGIELLAQARALHPGLPFLLVTAFAEARDAVTALKLGAVDYLAKPVDLDELLACVEDALGVTTEAPDGGPPAETYADFVAASAPMRALLRDAWRIAGSDVNVLIEGESGVGKEVLARFIHQNSARAKAPMVAVNCAALPSELLASELFGHERGAFTGATAARAGRFREAEGGVLFLDEIGDMPLPLQPVLLRAIENRTVTPLGATGVQAVDFRLVAATNRGLEDQVAAGHFRSDLYYRLSVITLEIPPLRERTDDILPMARRFLAEGDGDGKRISRAAATRLLAHDWPGNVRELKNAMQRARLLSRTEVILPDHLPPAVRRAVARPEAPPSGVQTLRDSEIDSLRAALEETGGNRTRAAELLGITRRGLHKKMKRFELE